jgi:hypothetical protein
VETATCATVNTTRARHSEMGVLHFQTERIVQKHIPTACSCSCVSQSYETLSSGSARNLSAGLAKLQGPSSGLTRAHRRAENVVHLST